MSAKSIIRKFGGQSALAELLGKSQSTIAYWAKTDAIPQRYRQQLLDLARDREIPLDPAEFELAASNSIQNNSLVSILPSSLAALSKHQQHLPLGIEKQIEIDGVGMGVLSDGTPFLTGRGLARLCGVAHSVVQTVSLEWDKGLSFPRAQNIREIIDSHGGGFPTPYIEIKTRSGAFYAYPDTVCLALLEYYSFDAGTNVRDEAKKNYRLLAGKALREFIYTQVGYDPRNAVPEAWRQFHDRVSLTYNSVPQGFFGVFKEIADMIVTLGQAGLHIDDKFVPDISVGMAWGKHWKDSQLDERFGNRSKFDHNYPDYFPQSASNPQDCWCYPDSALGEFRHWFRASYIGERKFAKYIEGKVRERSLPVSFAQLAIAAYEGHD